MSDQNKDLEVFLEAAAGYRMLDVADRPLIGHQVVAAADALGLTTAENKRLKAQLDEFVYAEDNPDYVSESQKRIEQLEAAARELINDDRACDCAECLIGESDAWVQLTELLLAGGSNQELNTAKRRPDAGLSETESPEGDAAARTSGRGSDGESGND